MKILIVEDETRMAQALCQLMKNENYEADCCLDGLEGLYAIETGIYDAVILDVMLPGMNGFEIIKEVRNKGIMTPIILLTAKSELDDKVNGLDSGADDYLTKPFMTKELLARVRAVLRRNASNSNGIISYGDIELDKDTATLRCLKGEQCVRLSEKEYHLLEYLMINGGKILTREQLAVKIWGYENDAEYNNVEVYLSFTRKKLTFVGSNTEIKAVRGIGYELRFDTN